MNNEYVINEEITLNFDNITDVYEKCLSWIKLKKGKIVEEKRYSYIKAEHGRGEGTQAQNIGKYFIIKLSQENMHSVNVSFKIPRLKWLPKSKFYIYYYWWYEFVENLWRYLGASIDKTYLRHLYPYDNLKNMINRTLLFFYFTTIILGILVIIFLFSVPIITVLPIILWYFASYPSFIETKNIKKKLEILYPNKN